MNRNSEQHYTELPRANIQRARFKRDYSLTTTLNEGDIVPIYVDEVLPGDTISINQTSLIRMMTPIYPIMDNAYCDFYYFFVPNRLLWNNWEKLNGANDDIDSTYWAQTTTYTTPKDALIFNDSGATSLGLNVGTIGDYMGIPTGVNLPAVNALPARAYAKIWNDWFRDENLQQPIPFLKSDKGCIDINMNPRAGSNVALNNGIGYLNGTNECSIYQFKPAKAAKFHDYFTSCLPQPQKGEALDVTNGGMAIVKTAENVFSASQLNAYPLRFKTTTQEDDWEFQTAPSEGGAAGILHIVARGGNTDWYGETTSSTDATTYAAEIVPSNLYAEIDTVTVNQLRQAIALQHVLEADARNGTRYTEILEGEFGVTSPDSRLQRSEYIGGYRMPININQVIQQSSTDSTSPQGNVAAYSLTTGNDQVASYSSVEHGFILGLAVIRVNHTYQQGLSRMWQRSDRWSYYHPMLANLGEQAVLESEIYATSSETQNETVFGYQEAWADYRYHVNMVTGQMRNGQGLEAWTYADYYDSAPTLSSSWIQEGSENIAKTLAVEDTSLTHQFIADIYYDQTWTRPLPIYSIPGLSTI